ncbi:immunoglobulin gamma-1 heavy chain-like [Scyliorhinus canicula]|uniref:immunoglobulin gamma-1 heavy chain-like n=1 Tax=Scyliorhinus canicula TaxID=7830 RepID=UPI0018F6DD58|nr:immunoglobulin gamma-1 heavy chain-like [Scyliorhinus canicula]
MGLFTLGAFFHLIPVIFPQDVFQQTPAEQTVSVGGIFKVHCHTGWLASAAVYWYKQQHREHLQFVHIVRKHIPADGRFSGIVDDASAIYTLVIKEVQRNDSGVYYCAARKSNGMSFIFGNGSKLLTTGPAAIFLLAPPLADILSMETIPLMCLVNGASSIKLPVRWNLATWETQTWSHSGTIDSDGVYNIGSQLTVSADTCTNGALCTCSVQTNASEHLISEPFSYQREPPQPHCLPLIYGGSLLLILLLVVLTILAGWSCRIWHSGNSSSNQTFSNWEKRERDKETLYAHLAFTPDPTL